MDPTPFQELASELINFMIRLASSCLVLLDPSSFDCEVIFCGRMMKVVGTVFSLKSFTTLIKVLVCFPILSSICFPNLIKADG